MQNQALHWEKYRPVIFLYLFVISSLIFVSFYDWNFVDAFITYRYAHNLANGQGFVFNPGQRVLSTTTPLFTLLLAVISYFWGDIPHLANLIGAIGIGLGAFFLWEICLQKKIILAGLTCLLLYPSFPLLVTTIGLETSLYISFCLGAILFYQRQQYSWSAVFSALSCLTRPDGLILAVVLCLHYLITHRHLPPLKPILIFLCLLSPWLLFSQLYFGTFIPASFMTKTNQGAMLISERFTAGMITTLRPYFQRILYVVESILFFSGLALIFFRKYRYPTILYSWTAAYFLAFVLLGVSRYSWYYAPLVPMFIVSIGVGLAGLHNLLTKVPGPFPLHLPTIFVVSFLVILGIGQFLHLMQLKHFPDPRRSMYRAISKWLLENTATTDMVGTLEVGTIGFYSSRPILDFAGLLQPEIGARLGAESTYEDSALWAMENHHPQYIVLQKGQFPALEVDYLPQHCHNVRRFDGIDYGYEGELDIYKCVFK